MIRTLNASFAKRWVALILSTFAFVTIGWADPVNFIVDNFTFVRPPDWKWVWDEKRAKTGMLLEVQGANMGETAVVYFRKFNRNEGSLENRIQSWQSHFRESPENLAFRSETKTVGGYSVMYVEIGGTYVRKPHSDYGLIGAIVKLKEEQHFAVRMSGPKQLVENSKSIFREMIERALIEKAQN